MRWNARPAASTDLERPAQAGKGRLPERNGEGCGAMFIDGVWCEAAGGGRFRVTNPANGEIVGDVPDGGGADAIRAIDAAERAFDGWAGLTAYDRSRILYRAWEIMTDRAEDLARTMTLEQGKPLRASRNEVRYGADFLLWYAEKRSASMARPFPPRAATSASW